MTTTTHRGDHQMRLANFIMDTTDRTSVMFAKATPAVGLWAVSTSEKAQTFLDQFAMLPWGAISGFFATIYSLCLISEWTWKKVSAVLAWMRAKAESEKII